MISMNEVLWNTIAEGLDAVGSSTWTQQRSPVKDRQLGFDSRLVPCGPHCPGNCAFYGGWDNP